MMDKFQATNKMYTELLKIALDMLDYIDYKDHYKIGNSRPFKERLEKLGYDFEGYEANRISRDNEVKEKCSVCDYIRCCDWKREHTCHNIELSYPQKFFRCSECGCEIMLYHINWAALFDGGLNYCVNCGARAVSDDD